MQKLGQYAFLNCIYLILARMVRNKYFYLLSKIHSLVGAISGCVMRNIWLPEATSASPLPPYTRLLEVRQSSWATWRKVGYPIPAGNQVSNQRVSGKFSLSQYPAEQENGQIEPDRDRDKLPITQVVKVENTKRYRPRGKGLEKMGKVSCLL